jgi:hypothetical protein
MGYQLVASPLLTAPGDCDDGEVGGMNGLGRGNLSTRRKPALTPLCVGLSLSTALLRLTKLIQRYVLYTYKLITIVTYNNIKILLLHA